MGEPRGQATVELALCLPVVALVLAAVVEIGLLVGDQARLWHAAREAARVAVVTPDRAAVEEAAARGGLDHLDVAVDPPPVHRVQGEPLTVEVGYRPPGRVPILGRLFSRLELHARSTMRIEDP